MSAHKKISYSELLFYIQFKRKVPVQYFLLTKKSIIALILGIGLTLFIISFQDPSLEKYQFFPLIASGLYIMVRYSRTNLKYTALLAFFPEGKRTDEDKGNIFFISWLLEKIKTYYNFEKEKVSR